MYPTTKMFWRTVKPFFFVNGLNSYSILLSKKNNYYQTKHKQLVTHGLLEAATGGIL